MKDKPRVPRVTVAPAVLVNIEVPRTKKERDRMLLVDDETGLISRFRQWQMDNSIYPYRAGSSGPGFLTAWFPGEHADAIDEFFASENVKPSTDDGHL